MTASASDGVADSSAYRLADRVADLAIVGGGLAGCLTALAYRNQHPAARVVLIERASELAGNHTWCCFASDLAHPEADDVLLARQEGLLAQVVEHRWTTHRVRFPSFERELRSEYLCVTAEKLRSVMRTSFASEPGSLVLTGTAVDAVAHDSVALADGRRIRSLRVVDARGGGAATSTASKVNADDADDDSRTSSGGYQKFLGREVIVQDMPARFAASPLVMDATVPQVDGFRFMYCLPLAADRLLLEDTSFSNRSDLDLERSRDRIAAYARLQGLRIARVEREEVGVLPMPGSGSDRPPLSGSRARGACETIGYAAGLFHSGTGYSLPIAVEMAVALAAGDDGDGDDGTTATRSRIRQQNGFFERLNRLMFVGVPPENRRAIFERFYQLPEVTIERFYGARTTWVDRARILAGRPPRGFRWREVLASSVRSRREEMAADAMAKTFKEAI